jgi:hypothetical protein
MTPPSTAQKQESYQEWRAMGTKDTSASHPCVSRTCGTLTTDKKHQSSRKSSKFTKIKFLPTKILIFEKSLLDSNLLFHGCPHAAYDFALIINFFSMPE